jgi:hypothetical protein
MKTKLLKQLSNKQLKGKRQQLGAHHHMVAMLVVA